ncbi:MAG: hypothetical protein R3C53_13920 [Pirellulaceae bacterium]
MHLFSPRSVALCYQTLYVTLCLAKDCIVLGGDIFDFRWSVQGSHAATLAATHQWLIELLSTTEPNVEIVFLPGNHDCHPDFLAQLQSLASCQPRFGWAEHHLQIGDTLFLRGRPGRR